MTTLAVSPSVRWLTKVWLMLIVLALVNSPASAKLEKMEWIEVSSPNFVVKSRLSEKRTLEVISNLELVRQVVLRLIGSKPDAAPIPLEILLLKNRTEFREFFKGEFIVGQFVPGIRRNLIVMRSDRGSRDQAIIQHEYMHYLIRNHSQLIYPKWFDEGFAELMGSTYVSRGRVVIGDIPKDRRADLQHGVWIEFKKILTAKDYKDWPVARKMMFYAESWAAVHYLQFARPKRNIQADLFKYLSLLESDGPLDAFREAFDLEPIGFELVLKQYLHRRIMQAHTLLKDSFVTEYEPRTRSIPPAEIATMLGQVALQLNQLPDARRYFDYAIELDPERGPAYAGLGDLQKFESNFAAALPLFEKARKLSAADPLVALDEGEYWFDRAKASESDEDRKRFLEKAEKISLLAWKMDDTIPEVYWLNGSILLLLGNQAEKAIGMFNYASSLMPSDLRIRLSLAEALHQDRRSLEALQLALSVVSWSHEDSDLRPIAEALVRSIQSAPRSSGAEESPASSSPYMLGSQVSPSHFSSH